MAYQRQKLLQNFTQWIGKVMVSQRISSIWICRTEWVHNTTLLRPLFTNFLFHKIAVMRYLAIPRLLKKYWRNIWMTNTMLLSTEGILIGTTRSWSTKKTSSCLRGLENVTYWNYILMCSPPRDRSIWNSGTVEYNITSFTWAVGTIFSSSATVFSYTLPVISEIMFAFIATVRVRGFPPDLCTTPRSLYAATHLTNDFLDTPYELAMFAAVSL